MSIDERLREGLTRNGYADPVATEPALDGVLRRRRVVVRRRVGGLVAAAVGIAALTPWAAGWLSREPGPAGGLPTELVGTFRVDVPDSAGARMAGRWIVSVGSDGRVTVDPPPDLPERAEATYVVEAGLLETDLLVDTDCGLPGATETGRYRWDRNGSTLTFDVVEDGCVVRRTLFSIPWREESS